MNSAAIFTLDFFGRVIPLKLISDTLMSYLLPSFFRFSRGVSIALGLALVTSPLWSAEPAAAGTASAPAAVLTDEAAELAKKLSNPISSLISLPFQHNFDFGAGAKGEGFQYKLNVQPVIPITLNEDWNLISRTIIPFVSQENVFGATRQEGLSDTVQSFFFSPQEPTLDGWVWGAGPALLLPTATEDLLGAEKWGAGPTAVVLKQEKGWSYGALANHLWSYAGEDSRQEVNATYLQPFLSYVTPRQTTYSLNLESSYDWVGEQWTVPINLSVAQLVKLGGAPVQFQLGGRYFAEAPDTAPDWGLRFGVTLLWPK